MFGLFLCLAIYDSPLVRKFTSTNSPSFLLSISSPKFPLCIHDSSPVRPKVPFVSHYGTILFPAWTVGIISCLYSNGKYFSTNENSDCLSVINPCLKKSNNNKQTKHQDFISTSPYFLPCNSSDCYWINQKSTNWYVSLF